MATPENPGILAVGRCDHDRRGTRQVTRRQQLMVVSEHVVDYLSLYTGYN
jgi:hypothetical protein